MVHFVGPLNWTLFLRYCERITQASLWLVELSLRWNAFDGIWHIAQDGRYIEDAITANRFLAKYLHVNVTKRRKNPRTMEKIMNWSWIINICSWEFSWMFSSKYRIVHQWQEVLTLGILDFSSEGVDISEQIVRIEMEVKRQADEALRPGMEVNPGG